MVKLINFYVKYIFTTIKRPLDNILIILSLLSSWGSEERGTSLISSQEWKTGICPSSLGPEPQAGGNGFTVMFTCDSQHIHNLLGYTSPHFLLEKKTGRSGGGYFFPFASVGVFWVSGLYRAHVGMYKEKK